MIDVTAAVIIDNQKLLIAQRRDDDQLAEKWELPGGKIEQNETLAECLQRELKEEFEIDAVIGKYLCSSVYEYPHIKINLVAFEVLKYEGDINLNSHKDVRWVSRDEIQNYYFAEADQPIIKEIVNRGLI